MNQIFLGKDARANLKAGVDLVYSAVAPTLGASGRNVVYNKFSRVPIITNDGVSIAREIEPEDESIKQGANLIKQVAERTNDEAGDGTTTSIILAHSIVEEGIKLLDSDPTINPMQLRREITEASNKVIEALKASAKKIETLEELEQVATISVEDKEIGKTIAKAIFDAGENGIVYVNESDDIGVSIEKIEGYQFNQGLVSPYLIQNVQKMETALENVVILITEMPLFFTNEFNELIKAIVGKGTKNILLICDEIHPDVIKFAVMNMAKSNFNLLIVKKPMQKEYLEDLAAITGAVAMTQAKGMIVPKVEYLGGARKVVVTEKLTTIISGTGEKIEEYILALQKQLEDAEDEITKTKLQERIARLTGGVYLLNVGEKTEAEQKYLKLKVDDAVNATKAAKEEGIITGGGIALFNISRILMNYQDNGSKIIYQSCIQPLYMIIKNSGGDCTEVFIQVENTNQGYNALTLEIVPDMFEAGIIDPVKVTRVAFANATSFASLLLTTECQIVPIPEKEDRQGKY